MEPEYIFRKIVTFLRFPYSGTGALRMKTNILKCYSNFLTAMRLPHGQLWAILKGNASPDVKHCVFYPFRREGHREPRNEIGFLSPAERLVGFEPQSQRLNPLSHSPREYFVLSSPKWVLTLLSINQSHILKKIYL